MYYYGDVGKSLFFGTELQHKNVQKRSDTTLVGLRSIYPRMSKPEFNNIFIILISMANLINSVEYFLVTSKLNYIDAINACYDNGGILGIITDEYQFDISREICMNTNNNCWIGLNKMNNNEWRYIDGTSVNGTYGFDNNGNPTTGDGPWANNEPNNLQEKEHCIHFDILAEYTWNYDLCSKNYKPLCMKIETTPMKQFSRYTCMAIIWYIFHIYIAIIFRYFTVPVMSKYSQANDLCNKNGGILASITNELENNIAIARCQDGISDNELSGCWIGLNKISGNWEYIDGTDTTGLIGFDTNGDPITGKYPWDINEPNNLVDNELCVHLRSSNYYRWYDVECSDILGLNVPLCMPTHNIQTITPQNTNNNGVNISLKTILIAGFTVFGCCLILLIVIYILSKKVYNAKNEEAIQKEKELASIGCNLNSGNTDISNNSRNNSNEKIINQIEMAHPGNIINISVSVNKNIHDNKIETNDAQIIYENDTRNKMKSIESLQIEGSMKVKTVKV